MSHKRRSSSLYKAERAKYKALFPKVKTHHLFPHERTSDDTEFNLFPWNCISHDAWHRLFHNLKTREVWQLLPKAYQQIWYSTEKEMKPAWRWEYRTLFCESEKREYSHIRGVGFWRERWREAFGSDSFSAAQHVMWCMMMTMAFGHVAYTDQIDDLGTLDRLIRAIPVGTDRAWAFETCFKRSLSLRAVPLVRWQIHELVRRTQAARPS